jgi:hypothetical protein
MIDRLEALLAGPLSMAATLHAATEVWRQRADRLRGHDASESEPEEQAVAHLIEALDSLSELAFRAAATEIALDETKDIDAGALVLRFDSVLGLNRAAGVLEECHRRLLTIYPAVDPLLIERTRQLAVVCRHALEEDGAFPFDIVQNLVTDVRAAILSL